jgi:hypothetical protein
VSTPPRTTRTRPHHPDPGLGIIHGCSHPCWPSCAAGCSERLRVATRAQAIVVTRRSAPTVGRSRWWPRIGRVRPARCPSCWTPRATSAARGGPSRRPGGGTGRMAPARSVRGHGRRRRHARRVRFAQSRFRSTGGVYSTGLSDRDGRLVTVREDAGRHNALDAAIGARWHRRNLITATRAGPVGMDVPRPPRTDATKGSLSRYAPTARRSDRRAPSVASSGSTRAPRP